MIGCTFTGEEFIKHYPNTKFYKLTCENETHNGYVYSDGLNVDIIPFLTNAPCLPCGFYFSELDNVVFWFNYGYRKMHWIREVTIPTDATIYVEKDKFKTNKFILGPRVLIQDFEFWSDEEFCLKSVKKNGRSLEFVKVQTPEICLRAIREDYSALEFVKNQTPEICIKAIKKNHHALQFVKEQTKEICLAAVKSNGHALEYVNDEFKTHEIYLEAVKSNGFAISLIKEKTPDLCLEAVKFDPISLQFIEKKFQTEEVCIEAVKLNGMALEYVQKKSLKICWEAFKQTKSAILHFV